VHVEILFFITGLILKCRRSSPDLSKLHNICFLHDNLKFIVDTDIDFGMQEDDRDACLE